MFAKGGDLLRCRGLRRPGSFPFEGAARRGAERAKAASWALAVWLAWAQGVSAQHLEGAVALDGIAIVAGSRAPTPSSVVLLQSDVELRARLNLLIGGVDHALYAPLNAELLEATAQELLGEALIAVEAARLALPAPSDELVEAELLRLSASAGGRAELKGLFDALGASEGELTAMVRRRAVVRAFLDANLEGTIEVSAAELEQLFRSESHPFTQRPFDEVRTTFRAWVLRRRLEDAVARWIVSLKQRIPYRVIGYRSLSNTSATR